MRISLFQLWFNKKKEENISVPTMIQQLSSREYPTLLFLLDHSWNRDWNRDIDENISVPTGRGREYLCSNLSFNKKKEEDILLFLSLITRFYLVPDSSILLFSSCWIIVGTEIWMRISLFQSEFQQEEGWEYPSPNLSFNNYLAESILLFSSC